MLVQDTTTVLAFSYGATASRAVLAFGFVLLQNNKTVIALGIGA